MNNLTLFLFSIAIVMSMRVHNPRARIGTEYTHSYRWALLPTSIACMSLCLWLNISISCCIALGIAGAVGLWAMRHRKENKEYERAKNTLIQFLSLMANQLRAGVQGAYASHAVIEILKKSDAYHAGTVRLLDVATRRIEAGGDPRTIFQAGILESPLDKELHRLGSLWSISLKHGIALAKVIEHHHTIMEARVQHDQNYVAQTKGAIFSARILVFLPIIGIALGSAMGTQPISFLLNGGLGGLVLIMGMILSAVGYIWSMKIIRSAQS